MQNKIELGFFPTPLQYLAKLSSRLGTEIYIKRDDQSGLATGGNKTRKLEFLIKEAIDNKFDTIITAGAQQSNHCRQTVAASVISGFECHILVNGFEPEEYQGNLLLDKILGANIHFSGHNDKSRKEDLLKLKTNLEKQGKKVYLIPVGGSNMTGALGYVAAMKELKEQTKNINIQFDYIFFASSSGGTQAGMMLGKKLHKLNVKLMPVKIDKDDNLKSSLEKEILDILQQAVTKLNISKKYKIEDIKIIKNYNSDDYGKLTQKEKLAIDTLAKTEGILLDPVYTARAFYGMMDMLKKNLIKPNSKILFWHTGGISSIFAYNKELLI